MKKTLRSTTSIVLCAALITPPAMAQDMQFPCVTDAGLVAPDADALAAILSGAQAGEADASGTLPICGTMTQAEPAAEAEAEVEAEAAVEAEPAAEAEPATEAEAEGVAEPEPAAEPEAETEAEAVAEPAAEVAPEVEAAPAAEVEPAAEPVVEAEPEAEAVAPVEQAEPEAEIADVPEVEAEAETEAEAKTEVEAEIETPAEEPSVEDAEVPAVEAEAEPAAEAAPEAETEAETEAEVEAETLDATVEAETAEDAPAAAASAETDDAEAEVVTEDVTEESVRSSSEDFETEVTGDVSATTETAATESSEGGLSNFEKALLLGLGAAVVGSVLNNGDEVVSNTGDRVIVEREGVLRVLKNDDVLLRQAGSQVATQTFNDGSTRTVITREDGSQIITIRGNDGRVLRRTTVLADGTEVQLFDDTVQAQPVNTASLPVVTQETIMVSKETSDADLRAALLANLLAQPDRTFSLEQVRDLRQVRALAPQVELDTVTFASGSAAIDPSQAGELGALGQVIGAIVSERPETVFLIEGHTDAVGAAGYNLALSDRRAETVALALTEYFGVPPENLITQGYGETDLKIITEADERANRRAAIRNVTALLR